MTQVAIDGPAGSGKTTVARALARRLGALYLDTGAMYRALALLALQAGADPRDEAALESLARLRPLRVELDASAERGFRVFAGAAELGDELESPSVNGIVSLVAAHPRLRDLMVRQQQAIAAQGPVVMAGRDIGTVVLPQAPVKVFLTASSEVRVERRLAEQLERGARVVAEDLRRQLEERDRLDSERRVAPLRPATDAVVIDSSRLSVEQVVERIAALVEHARQA